MGRKAVHEEILELLPWFVNESLGEKESQRLLAHLQDCAECREERDRLQALQQMVVEDDGSQTADYSAAFSKLMSRITAAEDNRASTLVWRPRRRTAAWTLYLAAAACIVAAVGFVLVLNPSAPPREEFRTLSAPPLVDGVPHRIALTFEQPIKAETLRSALIETGSNIVSGPSEDGTYIVEIRIPPDMPDSRFIQSIREIDGVKYAVFAADTLHLGR